MNDLWKYSPLSDQWTWVGGSQEPYNFGTSSNPPALSFYSSFVSNGNLYIFGGISPTGVGAASMFFETIH